LGITGCHHFLTMKAIRCKHLIVPATVLMFLTIPVKAEFKLINLGTLRGDVTSSAAAINDCGEIVGESVNSNGIPHAFSYRNGRMSELSTDPSKAAAINDAGQIVGSILAFSTNIVIVPPLFPPNPLTNPIVILPTNPVVIPPTNIIVRPLTNHLILLTDTTTKETAVPNQNEGGILPTNGEIMTNLVINSQAVLFRPGLSVNLLESTNPGYASGVNNQGDIVGSVTLLNDLTSYAFVYKNGLTTDLPVSSSAIGPAAAMGINNRGDIVGFSGIGPEHPFLYSHGLIQDLGTLGGSNGEANAINDLGEIVGSSETTSNAEIHAFLYRQGQMTDLGTLKGGLSYPNTNVSTRAFPPIVSEAYAINNWGMIVGIATAANGAPHAFVYNDGKMTDLNDLVKLTHTNGPPGFLELNGANGINDSGQIVGAGRYWDGAHETGRAFLMKWSPEHRPSPTGVMFDRPGAD
jgi:probable HAF family extracellular repeat protein